MNQCGNATDMAMESALINKAAYIMCPCCVGKLKFALEGGTSTSAAKVPPLHPMAPTNTYPLYAPVLYRCLS